MTDLWVLDERQVWWKPVIEAGAKFGLKGRRIARGEQCGGGYGFIRPHADPKVLPINLLDYEVMVSRCDVYQDRDQVVMYEDKSAQAERYRDWLPETWRFTDEAAALALVDEFDGPLVSKADVGASSANVRILTTAEQARAHVRQVFRKGIQVNHCAGGARSIQKDYVLLQRFIPHQVTWRVNAIGRGRAVFMRYCYPDKPVAQTGNTDPVFELDDQVESLLDYADGFFAAAGTRWCAIDVLRDGDRWTLLETSLAWPWPGVGRAAPIFRTRYTWPQMFECMFDEWLNAS